MNRLIPLTGLAAFLLPLASGLAAQEPDLDELKSEAAIFTGVLQEGLGLGDSSGFLGIGSGRIESTYLGRQGLVIEIRSPLANQKNRLSLSALASSLRRVRGVGSPFAELSRQAAGDAPSVDVPATVPAQQSRATAQVNELAVEAYQRSVDEIRSFDYENLTETALAEANRTARMLRDIGAMDPPTLVETEQALAELRREFQEKLQQLRQLQSADEGVAATADGDRPSLIAEDGLQQLRNTLAEISNRASQQAQALDSRYEQAREEFRQRWLQQVAELETSLFGLLCDYGMTLRSLPAGQQVSVVLLGLGTDSDNAVTADRIHVVSHSDLMACEAGEISAGQLQQRGLVYNY